MGLPMIDSRYELPVRMVTPPNSLLALVVLVLISITANAQAPADSGPTVNKQDSVLVLEQQWHRTRFHLTAEVASPSEELARSVESPALGGAFAVEFASRSRVRPLLDLTALFAQGARSQNIQHPYFQLYTSHTGLRWFPGRKLKGVHLDLLWGLSVQVTKYPNTYPLIQEGRMYAKTALSLAAGLGAVVGPVAFSMRYEILPNYNPWDRMKQWDGKVGFAVLRMGFVLGGGTLPFPSTQHGGSSAKPPAGGTRGKGSIRSQLAWQTIRADSLEQEVAAKQAATQQLEVQQTELRAEIERQKRLTEQAEKETDSLRSQAPEPITPQFSVLHENVYRFNAIAVYTVLHPFSTPLQLDTFRVVTTIPPGGGYKHELQIATVNGNLYKEEFYALPLPGVTPGPTADEERELLRVRMALAPDAFLPEPVSDAALALSEAREARDLVFQLTKEQFKKVLQDHPPVGFRFQSDERTTKVLVYSPSLDRIVNIQPE